MNNETYTTFTIGKHDDVLIGLLTQFDFDSFQEEEDKIIAYIKSSTLTDDLEVEILNVIHGFTHDVIVEYIEPQNWNEIWEASFTPVIVRDFCQVRADFHTALPGIQYDLIINPKMAFGTGHHATTYMMMDRMSSIDFNNKSVCDFGCGTGILAILADKLGASEIDAVDIEHESYVNTVENAQINSSHHINAYEGELSDVPIRTYDIILANINRNILTRYADELYSRLNNGGQLLLSGVLEDDQSIVLDSYVKAGFYHKYTDENSGWVCMQFLKT